MGNPANRQPQDATTVQISTAGQKTQTDEAKGIQASADAANNDPVLDLIRLTLEKLTGHRLRVFDASDCQPQLTTAATAGRASAQEAPRASAGFGVEYDYHAVYGDTEQTAFSAQGVVQTANGKTIQFQPDLSMARQYREQTDVSMRAGDAQKTDSLLINFNGSAAQLTDQRFAFDLNADGSAE